MYTKDLCRVPIKISFPFVVVVVVISHFTSLLSLPRLPGGLCAMLISATILIRLYFQFAYLTLSSSTLTPRSCRLISIMMLLTQNSSAKLQPHPLDEEGKTEIRNEESWRRPTMGRK